MFLARCSLPFTLRLKNEQCVQSLLPCPFVKQLPITKGQAFRQGLIGILPLTLGVVPFGLVTGIAGIKAGLSPFEITAMSAFVYAGAAQLVALQLMSTGSSTFFVILAVMVVNLRYIMYSSAIAKHLKPLSQPLRALAAFELVDQNFVLTLNRSKELGEKLTPWFFLGAGAPLWFGWNVFTFIGATLGTRVPENWSLEFAVPLCFLVLLVPNVRNRPTFVAAVVGGITATLLTGLPYRSGLFVGAIAGIAAGAWLEYRREAKT
jgi:predicted branched-subunit amino acid permease